MRKAIFSVPRTTLQRLCKSDLTPEDAINIKLGRRTVLGEELERALAQYVLEMEAKFYGLTRKDLKRMAYSLAIQNGIKHPFKNNVAGRGWLDLFLGRNKDVLSIRRPTGTSFSRAKGFNKENVATFFNNLDGVYEKFNFPSSRIFNVDETGLTVVQNKIVQVVGRKG